MKTEAVKSDPAQGTPYLSLQEVAILLRLDVRSVRRMIKTIKLKSGKNRPPLLRAFNISTGTERNLWRVSRIDFEEFIRSRMCKKSG